MVVNTHIIETFLDPSWKGPGVTSVVYTTSIPIEAKKKKAIMA